MSFCFWPLFNSSRFQIRYSAEWFSHGSQENLATKSHTWWSCNSSHVILWKIGHHRNFFPVNLTKFFKWLLLLHYRTFQGYCAYTIQRWWREISKHIKDQQKTIKEEISAIKIVKKGESILSRNDAAKKIQQSWRKHIVSILTEAVVYRSDAVARRCPIKKVFWKIS